VRQYIYPIDRARLDQYLGLPFDQTFDWPRLSHLLGRLRALEDIQIRATYDLSGNFYRDHLIHTIRDTLLAAILSRLGFALDDDRPWACTVAALFHDLAYPIASGHEISETIARVLNDSYPNFDMRPATVRCRTDPTESLRRIFSDASVLEAVTVSTRNYNHAPMSAIEFLSYFKTRRIPRRVKEAAQAIALHDSKVGVTIPFSKYPVAFVVLIADELQDWDRPVGSSRDVALPSLTRFERGPDRTIVKFDYSGLGTSRRAPRPFFSPLAQIAGKQRSMSRLLFDAGAHGLVLLFALPAYERQFGSVNGFLERCQKLAGRLSDDYGASSAVAGLLGWPQEDVKKAGIGDLSGFLNADTNEFVLCNIQDIPDHLVGATIGERILWTANAIRLRNSLKGAEGIRGTIVAHDPVAILSQLESERRHGTGHRRGSNEGSTALGIALIRMFIRNLLRTGSGARRSAELSAFDNDEPSAQENWSETGAVLDPAPEGHPRLFQDWMGIAVSRAAEMELIRLDVIPTEPRRSPRERAVHQKHR